MTNYRVFKAKNDADKTFAIGSNAPANQTVNPDFIWIDKLCKYAEQCCEFARMGYRFSQWGSKKLQKAVQD